jgi:hypothetical protein
LTQSFFATVGLFFVHQITWVEESSMHLFNSPPWTCNKIYSSKKLVKIPREVIAGIRSRIESITSNNPLVTIIVGANNDEVQMVKCLYSLSKSKTTIPFEIIVSANNTSGSTISMLDQLNVRYYHSNANSGTISREIVTDFARGKIILQADASSIYPKTWVQKLTRELLKSNTSIVSGKVCYLNREKRFLLVKILSRSFWMNFSDELRYLATPCFRVDPGNIGYHKTQASINFVFTLHTNPGAASPRGRVKVLLSSKATVWREKRLTEAPLIFNNVRTKQLSTQLSLQK